MRRREALATGDDGDLFRRHQAAHAQGPAAAAAAVSRAP